MYIILVKFFNVYMYELSCDCNIGIVLWIGNSYWMCIKEWWLWNL